MTSFVKPRDVVDVSVWRYMSVKSSHRRLLTSKANKINHGQWFGVASLCGIIRKCILSVSETTIRVTEVTSLSNTKGVGVTKPISPVIYLLFFFKSLNTIYQYYTFIFDSCVDKYERVSKYRSGIFARSKMHKIEKLINEILVSPIHITQPTGLVH